jgi:DegV family protein with EDD domain
MQRKLLRRIGVVTDASSDLPRPLIDAKNIAIMPGVISNGIHKLWDTRDIKETQKFLEVMRLKNKPSYNLEYLSAQQYRDFYIEHLIMNFDDVFYLTSAASRSPILQIANKASEGIISKSVAPRHKSGVDELFRMHVIDSTVIFTGLGLIASDIVDLIDKHASVEEITKRIHFLKQHTQTYIVPAELSQLYHKAKETGDNSLGFTKYILGRALNIKPIIRCYQGNTEPVAEIIGYRQALKKLFRSVSQAISKDLVVNKIFISYAGNTNDLIGYEGFNELIEITRKYRVEVHVSVSSPVSALYVGANVLTLGLATFDPISFN